jgi:hypothetical protein
VGLLSAISHLQASTGKQTKTHIRHTGLPELVCALVLFRRNCRSVGLLQGLQIAEVATSSRRIQE